MPKANQGIVLVVTLLFIFVSSLQVAGLSEQLVQGNKLVSALQYKAAQTSRYKSFDANLQQVLARVMTKTWLAEFHSEQEVELELPFNFTQLLTCPVSLEGAWAKLSLPAISANSISYIRNLARQNAADTLLFVVVSCIESKVESLDFTTLNIYSMTEHGGMKRQYHTVLFAQGESL